MLNSKERSKLLAIANSIDTTVYIGKFGLTEQVLAQIDQMLTDHELIKVGVQKNADFTAKQCIAAVCEELHAEPIHAIGSKMIIYRYSTKDGIVHINYKDDVKKGDVASSGSSVKQPTSKPMPITKPRTKVGANAKPRNNPTSTQNKGSKGYSPIKKDGITIYRDGKRYGGNKSGSGAKTTQGTKKSNGGSKR